MNGDDSTTVQSFVAGDEQALAEVYARWSSPVYSLALASLGDVTEAEEVTQRVFTEAWTSRHTFDPTRTQLSAWLIGIACQTIADVRAARTDASQPATQSPADTAPGDEIVTSELVDRLVLADEMSRLPATPQQVLRMAFADGLTHDQIAERTGLPAGIVKNHIRRGLLELRKRLAVVHGAY